MLRSVPLALGLLLLTLACAVEREAPVAAHDSPLRAALRSDVVGCWKLTTRWGWSVEDRIDWAPTYVALRGQLLWPGAMRWSAVRYSASWKPLPLELERGIRGLSSWGADSLTDSVSIGFSNGFYGSVFIMALPSAAVPGNTMRGRAYEFSDAGPPFEHAKGFVKATRVRCDTLTR